MTKRTMGLLALVLLIAVDFVLVAFAIQNPTTSTAAGRTDPIPAASASATASPSPGSSTARSGAALIASLRGGTALVAIPGTCADGGSSITVTTDAAKSWTKVDSPAAVVGSAVVTDTNAAAVVGAGPDCEGPQLFRSTGGLGNWQSSISPTENWYLLPRGRGEIAGPGGLNPSPCDATAALLPTLTDRADVLCTDGAVQQSDDGGATWTQRGRIAGARALAGTPGGRLFALGSAEGCQGAQLSTSEDGGATWKPTTCATEAKLAGAVGLAADDRDLLAIATDQAYVSTDAGATLTAAGKLPTGG